MKRNTNTYKALCNIRPLPFIFERYGTFYCNGHVIATVNESASGAFVIVELLDIEPEFQYRYSITNEVLHVEKNCSDPFFENEKLYSHLQYHSQRYSSACDLHPSERCSDCHLRNTPCFINEGAQQ